MRVLLILASLAICSSMLFAADWDDLPDVKPASGDWPWWRGPTHDSKAEAGQKPPVKWSKTENILWNAAIPGRGHGSPTIWGNKIFLVTADDNAQAQYMLCLDRETGRQLWQTTVHKGGFMRSHKKNSHASGTPACDGERVFIAFMVQEAIWLTALDLDGKIVWQENLGKFQSVHGYVGTPVIYKSAIVINFESMEGTFVTARHRKTGKEIWRTKRSQLHHSFSTPSIGHCCGKDQLVLVGPKEVESFDPNTGKQLWSCEGPSDVGATTATFSDTMVYASAGFPKRALLAIRGDGSGDVTKTHVAWIKDRETAYVTSMLLHDGLLYMVHDNNGELWVFEPETGKVVYQQPMSGPCSSSPILAGDNIYLADEAGVVTVFKPGRTFEKVAVNDLGDGGFASPTICKDRIYLRTLHHLYCIGQ